MARTFAEYSLELEQSILDAINSRNFANIDIEEMELNPDQAEIIKRVQRCLYRIDDIASEHCERCAEEFDDALQQAVFWLRQYRAGLLTDVRSVYMGLYRSHDLSHGKTVISLKPNPEALTGYTIEDVTNFNQFKQELEEIKKK